MLRKLVDYKIIACGLLILGLTPTFSQQGLPIYTDYLTDNYYLVHPSMAGISDCAKVRFTGRQQWFGHENAPRLFTLSANGRIGDTNSGIGAIIYRDRNGFHNQTGAYATYAHHINLTSQSDKLNLFSFGLSAGVIQYNLDQSAFFSINQPFDPIASNSDLNKANFNMDVGISYNYQNFYTHATVKNIIENDGINTELALTSNLRQYLLNVGYVFQLSETWLFEPSTLFMHNESTSSSALDFNTKFYKSFDLGELWLGLSYRVLLDGEPSNTNGAIDVQYLQQLTPLIGFEKSNFLIAYNYNHTTNKVAFEKGGFHQITLGFKFGCGRTSYSCGCPALK